MVVALPRGFSAHVANIGIKDDSDDLVVVLADRPCAVAAMFTRNRFAGASVNLSREHLAAGGTTPTGRAMVVISKNANVATGPAGAADAREIVASVAAHVGCPASQVLIASTGVIGRRYPIDKVRAALHALPPTFEERSADAVARAMMTTDTVAKVAEANVGNGPARVVGVAKGVGMIEPDMATMIALVFTDAEVPVERLDSSFRDCVDRTLNCVSIDSDTSTSDTAAVFASGVAGSVDAEEFVVALRSVLHSLALQIARDGEGAKKLIEVRVDGARDDAQARRVAKSIVNSPLVKTAVHGADPNWGRVAMAIGKCNDDDIDQDRVVIRFGEREVYPDPIDDSGLAALSEHMAGTEVSIHVSLGIESGRATVWGCDLSAEYVRINADYTT